MLVSPLAFYRGSAAIMAADLAAMPNSGLEVQLCGDAHLANFGAFMAPDRRLIFDINDFDETYPGPFEWDVKRLAASFEVAARGRGFDARERRPLVLTVAGEYRREIHRLAAMPDLEVWYSRVDVETIERFRSRVGASGSKELERHISKAERKNSLRALSRLTRQEGDSLRIISDPPLVVPIDELAAQRHLPVDLEALIKALIEGYRRSLPSDVRRLAERYRYVDAAHKVVGVGSVGARCWIVLMLGRDDHDPLFLQAKEAGPSVLEPYSGRRPFQHQGRRVVEGQRLMQAASDIFLGWLTGPGIGRPALEYHVRQLWDGKGSAQIERFDLETLQVYATLCAWTLARGHARSGDPIAIAGYLGGGDTFDRALGDFAVAYADQNERDHEAFAAAVDAGGIAAQQDL
jgi:uncharacterized protein (DUF2252 family)